MNEKKSRMLRKLLVNQAFKKELPYLQVIQQAKNTRGMIRDEEYYLQIKYLKRCWSNASILEKPNFITLITTGGFK